MDNNAGIRINPLGRLGGSIGGDITMRVNPQLSIGPMFVYQDMDFAGSINKISGGCIRADWHFKETYRDGGYLSLQSSFYNMENQITKSDVAYKRKGNDIRVIGAIGYLWRWDSVTFNIAIGGGYSSFGNPDYVDDSGNTTKPLRLPDTNLTLDGDFSLGWAF